MDAFLSRDRLRDLLVSRGYRYDPAKSFELVSGEHSSEYIDCKSVLSDPEALAMIGPIFLPLVRPESIAVGGLTMGADPIAISVSLHSGATDHPLRWFSVRKGAKEHGLKKLIEGNLPPRCRVTIIDDVVTKGGSTLEAIHHCRADSHEVVQVIVLVDREQGGLQRIKNDLGVGVPVKAIFTKSELHAAWQARHQSRAAS